MYIIKRTNSEDIDFQKLVVALDTELAIRNGENNAYLAQFNTISSLQYVAVLFEDGLDVGCGAIKQYVNNAMEIKRMYVRLEKRGEGIASIVLKELENWTKELGFKKCILETGKNLPEAVRLYNKNNFVMIKNYGQYADIENCVCFQKDIQ